MVGSYKSRRIVVALLPGLALALAACGESPTGPDQLDVRLRVKQQWPATFSEYSAGQPTISCQVELHATVTGDGRAVLEDAKLYFAYGTNRGTPTDTAVVPAEFVHQIWDATEIHGSGGTWPTVVTLRAGAPFTATLRFFYRESGKDARSSDVTLDCGPRSNPDAPAPRLTIASIDPVEGTLKPGSTITVRYVGESSVGMWQTGVSLRGGCNVDVLHSEFLQTSMWYNAQITLPEDCTFNEPIVVTVYARDARLVETSRAAGTLTIVDVTPPVIVSDPAVLFAPMNGLHFTGDTLFLGVNVSDNIRLSTVYWEVLPHGFVDSAKTSADLAGIPMRVVIRPEWAGPLQIRVRVRDAVGLMSGTVTSAPVTILPTIERPTRSVALTGGVRDFTIDMPRNAVYLLKSTPSLDVFSLATMSVTRSITLAGQPRDADLSLTGDSLLIVMPGPLLEVLDLRAGASTTTTIPLALPPFHAAVSLRVAANGKLFVTAGTWMLEVALPSGTQRVRDDAGVLAGDALIARSHDRSTLVFNPTPQTLQVYDAATDQFFAPRSMPNTYSRMALNGNGDRILRYFEVFNRALESLVTVAAPQSGLSEISPDGLYVYSLSNIHGMIRSRVSDGAIVDRTRVPRGVGSMHVSGDGTTLVLVSANPASGSIVTAVDLR